LDGCKELKDQIVLKSNGTDSFFMQQALKQAERAAAVDEVPVGAVMVDKYGKIVARAYNQTIKKYSPLAHAEILAIRKAAKKRGDWRLPGHTLYVTLEPCLLCMQLIIMSRIGRLVYGADSPLFGFSLDKYCSFDLCKVPLVIEKGIEADAAKKLLKQFFKGKRSRVDGAQKIEECRDRKN